MTRVLVIDDDDLLRRALCGALAEAGYEVIDAANGVAGLRLYRERGGADLVLVDIFMPEMDGLQVIRALRTEVPRPKVVAMSGGGRAGREDILKIAATLGAERTLTKPFAAHDLLDALRSLLEEP